MTAIHLLARLGCATLCFTVLAGLLMAVRRPLRLRLGAEAVYALWLLVPLSVALCAWPVHRHAVHVPAMAAATASGVAAAAGAVARAAAPHWLADVVLAAWLLGAIAFALQLCGRQLVFVRALGPLRQDGADAWTSARADAGPLLVGLLRPRIVLPADFATRYTAPEQAAVLAHERMHRARGDLWWNLLCALLRCAFWFHPLAAAAQRSYLADQELACDSAVLRRGGQAPRTYADALLKTQTAIALPLGCGMQAASPLKERILNLGRRRAPRHAGRVVALALAAAALGGAGIAWAATGQAALAIEPADGGQAQAGPAYRATLDLSVATVAPDKPGARQLATLSEELLLRGPVYLRGLRDGDGKACDGLLTTRGRADGSILVGLDLTCDGQPAGNPRLLVKPGVPATIAIGRTEKQADGSYATTRGFRLTIKAEPA